MKRAKAKPVKAWGLRHIPTGRLLPFFYPDRRYARLMSVKRETTAAPVTITEGHPPPAKRRKEKQ